MKSIAVGLGSINRLVRSNVWQNTADSFSCCDSIDRDDKLRPAVGGDVPVSHYWTIVVCNRKSV